METDPIEYIPLPHETPSPGWIEFCHQIPPTSIPTTFSLSQLHALTRSISETYDDATRWPERTLLSTLDLTRLALPPGMESFETDVLPILLQAVHLLPTLFPLPTHNLSTLRLRGSPECTISLSYKAAGCLLSAAFLGLLDTHEWFTLGYIFTEQPAKALGILQYLSVFAGRFRDDSLRDANLTFIRRAINDLPDLEGEVMDVSDVPIEVWEKAPIEDGKGMLQADFANMYLGGGVLGGGCVQEEIRIGVTNPELLLAVLLAPAPMGPCEAILMAGSEMFSSYTGYGHTTAWGGPVVDDAEIDPETGALDTRVVAFDALMFCFRDPIALQFSQESITRELTKAHAAFYPWPVGDSASPLPPIATGNWGCGAFGGNKALKACIQLLACALAGRPMVYCTFGDVSLSNSLQSLSTALSTSPTPIPSSLFSQWLLSAPVPSTPASPTVIDHLLTQIDAFHT